MLGVPEKELGYSYSNKSDKKTIFSLLGRERETDDMVRARFIKIPLSFLLLRRLLTVPVLWAEHQQQFSP